MSITDELRERAHGFHVFNEERLLAIADRIDAAVDGMIELPKDADGEYIHIGDKLIDEDDKLQKPAIVKCILYNDEGCVVSDIDPRGCWYDPSLLRHYHAPTVEDVLCDLLNEYRENECTLEEARLSEYASKLRLAEGEGA